jgi:hypothetical protein
MKPTDAMPWDEVEAELLAALPNDEPSDVWRYSDLLPRGAQQAQIPEPAPSSRRAG